MNLSRRDFIKGAVATAATLGLTACGAPAAADTTAAVSHSRGGSRSNDGRSRCHSRTGRDYGGA